jgi:hypothetical protein
MLPGQQQQMMSVISNLLSQSGLPGLNLGGDTSSMQGGGGGISPNAITNALNGGQQNTNTAIGGTSSNLNPSGGDLQSGAERKVTSQYTGENYKPGEVFPNKEGGQTSSPEDNIRTQQQMIISGGQNAVPILQNILKEAQPFLSKGGIPLLTMNKLAGYANQLGISVDQLPQKVLDKFGINKDVMGQYGNWLSDRKKVPETLIKAYGLPETDQSIKNMEAIVEPQPGEDYEAYVGRITKEINEIQNIRIPNAKKILSEGFTVKGNNSDIENSSMPKNTASKKNGYNPLSILDYNYSSAEEFKNAFDALDKESKNLVIKEMKKRGMT